MAAPINPAGVGAYGTEKWIFVETIANTSAPALATEVNAATSLDVSCYLYEGGVSLTVNTEKVTRPRRLCSTEQYESNGPTTYSLTDLSYAFDPQAAAASDGKKAYETLTEGSTGYLVRRQGGGAADGDNLAVGDFVDVVPIELGIPVPSKTGDGAEAEYSITQAVSVTAAPVFNVALAT